MVDNKLKTEIDSVWDSFWSSGITNPMTVIEQITYLMFMKQLDQKEITKEKIAKRTNKDYATIFNRDNERWSNFKLMNPTQMFKAVKEDAFEFIKTFGGGKSNFTRYMSSASFLIESPQLLYTIVHKIDQLFVGKMDIKGDLYEYLLSKLETSGVNGQFRTPQHIRNLMVELLDPSINDSICDPAVGTAGFIIEAADYIMKKYTSKILIDESTGQELDKIGDLFSPNQRKYYKEKMFYGYDFDVTMLRISAMNCILHDIDPPNIFYSDSLSENAIIDRKFSTILANPPFKGNVDSTTINKSIKDITKSKKTELLFLVLILNLLDAGGRAAVIVPEGVLSDASKSEGKKIREKLVEENKLEAVISLPHYVFKPYASVATSILIFNKEGNTDKVWMYKVTNDGFTDGTVKKVSSKNDLPEVRSLWEQKDSRDYVAEKGKHRFVDKREITDNNYELVTRYYLDSTELNSNFGFTELTNIVDVNKGTIAASVAKSSGEYDFVTTAAEFKKLDTYENEGEAILIPLVSSSGHGHASINRIHYVNGKYTAATILAVLTLKDPKKVNMKYLYYFLQNYKDEILVPLMKGAANVSLSLSKLEGLKVPLPSLEKQINFIDELEESKKKIDEIENSLYMEKENYKQYMEQFKDRFL